MFSLYHNSNEHHGTYSGAQKRCSLLERHIVWQQDRLVGIREHVFSHSTIVGQAGRLLVFAEPHIFRVLTTDTMPTGVLEHDDADSLPDFPRPGRLGMWAHRDNGSHWLMGWNDGSIRLVDALPDLVAVVY